jgi:hypothetical protein
MGGMGRADGKPGHHSPNFGGSVISKRSINRSQRGADAMVGRSSISHQKLDSFRQAQDSRNTLRALCGAEREAEERL